MARPFSATIGMITHVHPLIEAVCFGGLEPMVWELVASTVVRSRESCHGRWLRRLVGPDGGSAEGARAGELEGLTAAERSAVSLALGTVGLALPKGVVADPPDQHYTAEQIRRLQAVALAVDLCCQAGRTLGRALRLNS